jgi:outer membrane protein assembly factor BamB
MEEGKIFIVAPDRHITALDAGSGREIWDSGKYSCRESIGMSKNKKLVYIKNMTEGNVDAFYAKPDSQMIAWECKTGLGYEIAPSPITEKDNLIFVPTTSGIIYAINRKNHQVEWKYKVSNALINYVLPVSRQRILVTAFDGKVACLEYGKHRLNDEMK